MKSVWWFLTDVLKEGCLVGGLEHFLFSHILGIIIPTDFHIFQRGSNHQPDVECFDLWFQETRDDLGGLRRLPNITDGGFGADVQMPWPRCEDYPGRSYDVLRFVRAIAGIEGFWDDFLQLTR